MQLSVDEILQLSPDEASAKAAKGLVTPAKWPTLAFSDTAMWGECQGSGAKPYQVQVDKSGPAFRCSCPSRKFPCKHGLALLLLYAQHAPKFSAASAPEWVSDWLASRQQRAEKQEQKKNEAAEKPAAVADPEASAKREAVRVQRMAGGIDELERWLADRVRQGLAQLPGQASLWREIAARMVDAQLPGLAFRLRQVESLVGQGDDWPARVLARFGQMRLLIDAARRAHELPAAVLADLHTALGHATEKDAVLGTGEQVKDRWFVLGQSTDEEERLWVRRVWVQGHESGRLGLLLDYAHGTRRFEQAFVSGSSFAATLAFYPGAAPRRALLVDTPVLVPDAAEGAPRKAISFTLGELAASVSASPWQWPQAMSLGQVVPVIEGGQWYLRTEEEGWLRLRAQDDDAWQMLAESGGRPVCVFGEWDGACLRPLSCWTSVLVWTEGAFAA